jgi:RNA polymerase sigma-70 factor (ECF subfamily)
VTDTLAGLPVGYDDQLRDLMPALLAFFVRRITPAEDAADCLSETMVVLWRRRRSMPVGQEDARRWAFGVAKGVLANARRGRLRRSALADRVRADVAASVLPASDIELDVRRALDQLGSVDKELVTLIVWDGFGVAEAGALVGLKPEAARSRYSRARVRLRESLA